MALSKPGNFRGEADSERTPKLEILSGWKEISNYLGKGVRTVQRYERELALPVRRPAAKANGSVIATKAEIDAWVTASPIRKAFELPRTSADNSAILNEFRRNMTDMHRLREECAQLREEHHRAMQLLHENLRCSLPPQDQTPERPLAPAGVLPFQSKKKANSFR